MVKDYIHMLIELFILDFGKIIKEKDKELINQKVKIMKENG